MGFTSHDEALREHSNLESGMWLMNDFQWMIRSVSDALTDMMRHLIHAGVLT